MSYFRYFIIYINKICFFTTNLRLNFSCYINDEKWPLENFWPSWKSYKFWHKSINLQYITYHSSFIYRIFSCNFFYQWLVLLLVLETQLNFLLLLISMVEVIFFYKNYYNGQIWQIPGIYGRILSRRILSTMENRQDIT